MKINTYEKVKYTKVKFFGRSSNYLLLLVLVAANLMLVACNKSKQISFDTKGAVIIPEEGWLNEDTYKMTVYGQWDRSRYYVEGEAEESGKTAKPLFGLREDAKIAAKVKAMRNFKEKMKAFIVSETMVENSSLLSDVIDSTLSGLIISPASQKETYSARHDASIIFYFSSKGLRRLIEDAAAESLKEN